MTLMYAHPSAPYEPEDQRCPCCGEDLPSLFVATMHFKRCELRNSKTEPSED